MDVPFVIFADTESVLEEIEKCCCNLQKSFKTKINKHETWGYSLFKHCSFDIIRNKHDYYSGQDCNKPCNSNNQLWKKIDTINKCGSKSYLNQKSLKACYKNKNEFTDDDNGISFNKQNNKVSGRYHYTGTNKGTAHNICNLR